MMNKRRSAALLTACIAIIYIILLPNIGTLMLFAAIAVHEFGHILAILIIGERITDISVSPFGLSIKRSGRLCSYKFELIVYLSGPITNILLAMIFSRVKNNICEAFAEQNLIFGVLNMLPIKSLDGGSALRSALLMIISEKVAATAVDLLSAATVFIIWICSIWCLLYIGGGLSPFFFSCWLFFSLFLKDIKARP